MAKDQSFIGGRSPAHLPGESPKLKELYDVTKASPVDDGLLIYNLTGESWEPSLLSLSGEVGAVLPTLGTEIKQALTSLDYGLVTDLIGTQTGADFTTQLKHRRGTDTEIQTRVPALAELWYNTTDNTIHMGDGVTPGGVKQKEVLSVKHFGAKGDGVTDDTDSILAALQYARTTRGVLFFPGTVSGYAISRKIPVYSGVSYIGENVKLICLAPTGTGYDSTGIGNGCFINTNEEPNIHDAVISGFNIQCGKFAVQHGIRILGTGVGSGNIIITDCEIHDPLWDGVLMQGGVPQSGGPSEPWLEDNTIFNYLCKNVRCYNSDVNQASRAGFTTEYVVNGVLDGCFATGFNRGFHVEGSSEISYVSCMAIDNNGDWQRADNTNYGSDFLLARSTNVSLVNCTARRLNQPKDIVFPDLTTWTYKNIFMANPFMDGLNIVNFGAVGGEIRGNEAWFETETTRFSQSFKGCTFNDCLLVFIRQDNNQFFEGLTFTGCGFQDSTLIMSDVNGGTIANNTWANSNQTCLEVIRGVGVSIQGNTFKGGLTGDAAVFRNSQLILDSAFDAGITGNTFIENQRHIGFYSIGTKNCERLVISSNAFNKSTENAIKEQTGFPLRYSIICDNVCSYSGVVSTFIFAFDASLVKQNNQINGILEDGSVTIKSTGTLTWDVPSIATGSSASSPNIVCDGAAFGDGVIVIPPYDVQSLIVSAAVIQADRVRITLGNLTGSPVDLGSGDWKVITVR